MKHRIWIALVVATMAVGALLTQALSAEGAVTPIQFSGDLDGSYVSQTVVGLQGHAVPAPSVGALSWDGGAYYWGAAVVAPDLAGQALWTNDAGAATTWAYPHGDVDASATDPGALTVNAIQGFGVSNAVPTSTNVLAYSSGLWRPTALTTANISPGSAGQFLVTNGTPATAWSTLDTFETTHGRFSAGGSGSDFAGVFGPWVSNETSGAAVYLLPNATAANGTNYAMLGAGTGLFISDRSSNGINFYLAGSTQLASLTTSAFNLLSPPTIQWGPGISTGTLGTNKAGAVLNLQADAATTFASFSGTSPATTGEIRAPNNTKIVAARNAGNTADISVISTTSADQIVIGDVDQSITLSAVGGWDVTYASGGTFYSPVGNLHLGTNAGAGFHTFLSSGAGTDVVDVTVPSVGSENTAFTGSIDLKPTSAPSPPASNTVREYVDTADGKLKAKDASGNIFVLVP